MIQPRTKPLHWGKRPGPDCCESVSDCHVMVVALVTQWDPVSLEISSPAILTITAREQRDTEYQGNTQ